MLQKRDLPNMKIVFVLNSFEGEKSELFSNADKSNFLFINFRFCSSEA